jgi:hypothetical protein
MIPFSTIFDKHKLSFENEKRPMPHPFSCPLPIRSYILLSHAIRFDEADKGIAAWEERQNFIFTREDLFSEGSISGVPVLCISPEMQLRFHTGYELPEKQRGDLDQLIKRFRITYSDK